MCIQYIRGCSVHLGDIIILGDAQYIRGYHDACGDTMSTSGDTMSKLGDIMSTSGGIMSTMEDVQYIGVFNRN